MFGFFLATTEDAILQTAGSLVGAFLSALVAIGLWFSERRRLENIAKKEERLAEKQFKLVLQFSMQELSSKSADLAESLRSQISNHSVSDEILFRNIVTTLAGRRIERPETVKFGWQHIRYLSEHETNKIALVNAIISDIVKEQDEILNNSFPMSGDEAKLTSESLIELLKKLAGESGTALDYRV